MKWLTEDMKAKMQTATLLRERVTELSKRIDDLVSPFVTNMVDEIAAAKKTPEEYQRLTDLIMGVPDNFYRSELHTLLKTKFKA